MSGLYCSTIAEGALCTSVSVREGEKGPADPVDAFKSGLPVGGTKLSTGRGFLPAALPGKGDEVANLVGSSLTGKNVERPPLLWETQSRASRSRGFGVGLPAPQSDRDQMAGRWRSKTPSLIGATCRRSSLTNARRVAGECGAWCAGPRDEAERSGARGAGSCCLKNAVAEEAAPDARDPVADGTALKAQAPVP